MTHMRDRLRDCLSGPSAGRALLAAIFAAGILLRAANIGVPSMGDEGIYLYDAKEVYTGVRPYEEIFLAHPPLCIYLIALSYKFFGVGIMQGKLVDVLFSIASLPLIYLVTRRFYGTNRALFATFLVSTSYGVINFTSGVWLSSVPFFLSIFSSYLFLAGLEEGSWRRIALSGVSLGLALLCKLTALTLLATMLVYLMLKRERWKNVIPLSAGLMAVILPFLLTFHSKNLADYVVFYHLAKDSFPLLSRINLSFAVIFTYYPLLLIYGLIGLFTVHASKDRSNADVFYSVNALVGLLFAFTSKYSSPIVPALYFMSSSYAFAIIGGRPFQKTGLPTLIAIIALFGAISLALDIHSLNNQREEADRLMEETNTAIGFLDSQSKPTDRILLTDYPLYYIPLLSDRRVLSELSDLTPYRLCFDLGPEKIRENKVKAKYLITYNRSVDNRLLDALGVKKPQTCPQLEEGADALRENTTEAKRAGRIIIYLNDAYAG